jgi:hypothetical protein
LLGACRCSGGVANGNTPAMRATSHTGDGMGIRHQVEAWRQAIRLWSHINEKCENDRHSQYREFIDSFHRICPVCYQRP